MPNVALFDMAGNKKGEFELAAEVFGCEVNQPVLHSVVRAYLLNQRQGTQSTKTRAEVSGGGIKPWRQKGTGRARQGSTRSPQWTHGGIALGPKPKTIVNLLKAVGAEKKALIVTAENDKVVAKSAANIPGVKTATPGTLNVYDILNCDMFVVAGDAVKVIEEVYA